AQGILFCQRLHPLGGMYRAAGFAGGGIDSNVTHLRPRLAVRESVMYLIHPHQLVDGHFDPAEYRVVFTQSKYQPVIPNTITDLRKGLVQLRRAVKIDRVIAFSKLRYATGARN